MITESSTEKEVAFESHLRAIEDAVQVANLDGGCNHADNVLYHCNSIRGLFKGSVDEAKQTTEFKPD
jgi:hypothetical protein